MECIIAHELSRKIITWPLYQLQSLNVDKIHPTVIELMIQFPQLYIAGGALVSLLNKEQPNDWDLFIVGTVDQLNEILNYARKSYSYCETSNSISFDKIQIIKRLYVDPSHVIGGFDLDSCRLILIKKMNEYIIYTTATGYYAFKHKINIINPQCASASFNQRICKYNYRHKYKTLHIYGELLKTTQNQQYYTKDRHKIHTLNYKNKYASSIMLLLLKGLYDRLYTYGYMCTVNELLNELNDLNNGNYAFMIEYNGQRLHIDKYDYVIVHNVSMPLSNLLNVDSNTLYKSYRKLLIRERYHYYMSITSSMIVNTYTQFTGSFYPLTSNIYHIKKKCDILTQQPLLMFILSKIRMRFPRNIRIMIGVYYYANELINDILF